LDDGKRQSLEFRLLQGSAWPLPGRDRDAAGCSGGSSVDFMPGCGVTTGFAGNDQSGDDEMDDCTEKFHLPKKL